MLPEAKRQQLIDYWTRGSTEDFETALEIFQNTTRRTSALFFAHLAVEKALKAAIVQTEGVHAPYTHNLLHLVARLGWEIEPEIEASLAEINAFNLEGRYPDDKKSFQLKATPEYTQKQLTLVEKVLKWTSSKSNPGS